MAVEMVNIKLPVCNKKNDNICINFVKYHEHSEIQFFIKIVLNDIIYL